MSCASSKTVIARPRTVAGGYADCDGLRRGMSRQTGGVGSPTRLSVTTLGGLPGRALRLLLVLTCAFGASWGFAAGSHATSHNVVGSAQPSHHHVPSGHTAQAVDDVTATRFRRRIRGAVVRLLPAPVVPFWVRLHRALRRRAPSPAQVDPWPTRVAAASSPTRLAVCRT